MRTAPAACLYSIRACVFIESMKHPRGSHQCTECWISILDRNMSYRPTEKKNGIGTPYFGNTHVYTAVCCVMGCGIAWLEAFVCVAMKAKCAARLLLISCSFVACGLSAVKQQSYSLQCFVHRSADQTATNTTEYMMDRFSLSLCSLCRCKTLIGCTRINLCIAPSFDLESP